MTDMPEHTAAAARRRNAAASAKARQDRRRVVAFAGAAVSGAAVAAAGLVLLTGLRSFLDTGQVPAQTTLTAALVMAASAAALGAQAVAMRDGVTKEAGRWGRRLRALLTAIAAIIAAAASASGMWKFMGDVLHVDNFYARAAIFAVFEIALFTEALRARAIRVNDPDAPRWGPDAIAVWVFAVTTGVLAATDEPTWAGRAARVALALTAAWLFERLISEERAARQGKTTDKIAWRFSLERIAVRLGLADATGRTTAEEDRDRRLAQLATLAYRADTLGRENGRNWLWRRTRCMARYKRALAHANEHLGLANDPEAIDRVKRSVALLHYGVTHITADAVADASPWVEPETPPVAVRTSTRQKPRKAAGRKPATTRRPGVRGSIDDFRDLHRTHPGQPSAWYAEALNLPNPTESGARLIRTWKQKIDSEVPAGAG